MRLHQTAEDLCSDFLSTYSPSTPSTVACALTWCQQKKQQVKTSLYGLIIVSNHYHDESKDCITELASLAYLMIGHCITKLRNSLNNSVGKHIMTTFATLLMYKGGQFQRSYSHLLNSKQMIIAEWHPCRTMVLHIMILKVKLS